MNQIVRYFNTLLLGCGLCWIPLNAAHADGAADSIRVTALLAEAAALPKSENKILFFAEGFLGTPYEGGTLETFPVERLVVRTDAVDCTTFVEYVLALMLTDKELSQQRSKNLKASCDASTQKASCDASTQKASCSSSNQGTSCGSSPYTLFKQKLTAIRYRGGQLHGYTSRLHYFSEWITDNQRMGFVSEVTTQSPHTQRTVSLNFMTQHASLYPFLAHDTLTLTAMQNVERRFEDYTMHYIPKHQLSAGKDILKINDGDILTLVTKITGLDVVHVGFARWVNGQLHLLHASSLAKRVLLDPSTLHQYTQNKKTQIGIRVIRVL